ncbi:MAG TPA: Gfo/Idh/MocA family oxidoreductase [Bacteroidales bacterium]|nr:Gfo/Idh/MocA family oxidoreductase [Bacteroidales bacterium]
MKTNRRNFLRSTALGAGVFMSGISGFASIKGSAPEDKSPSFDNPKQKFNMSGYKAPKLDTVRIGFIGLGMRGSGAPERISHIEGIEIKAICDIREELVKKMQQNLKEWGLPAAQEYYGKEDSWKQLCERPDIDLVYICTPWALHTPMAVYAMKQGKHVAVEVPAARTLDECWQLVETSESTKKHCMMLENCCYDFFELLTLNMARQGLFGEIVHAEGAYIHNLIDLNFDKNGYYNMWRLKENYRNGNLYPTHGLGPVCQALNINRGDQMEYLNSMSTFDFQMEAKANELAQKDSFYKEFAGKKYRGNMNTTLIHTFKGKTIMIQHDVTSTRPYSRIHLLSGTKGIARKWPEPPRIAFGHEWVSEAEMKKIEDQYTPEIVKKIGEMAKKVGGHGGMDFMMDWRLIDCLRNGLPLDQDVYDAALWSSVTPLSEASVKNRSNSIDVPDFTNGSWKTNTPVSLSLAGGGTTGVVEIKKADASKQLNVH